MNSSIRLNVYPGPGERIVTANCARVTSVNNYATNGIVHMLSHVMRPVKYSVADLISKDSQFTIFRKRKQLPFTYYVFVAFLIFIT